MTAHGFARRREADAGDGAPPDFPRSLDRFIVEPTRLEA